MRHIVHTLPQPPWPSGFTAYLTAQMINGLAKGYLPWYSLHPLPPLYTSGVRFALEPNHGQGWEEYADPWTVFARKWGDCDDLILYRILELRASGERKARARAEWNQAGEIHVLVRRANGDKEDPSRILGG